MDARRLLTLAAAGVLLSGCALLRPVHDIKPAGAAIAVAPVPALAPAAPLPLTRVVAMAPIPNPPVASAGRRHTARHHRRTLVHHVSTAPERVGRAAIAQANAAARMRSRSDDFVGSVQVFTYDPGEVYEVWTAPLRVTTLTLPPGETIVSKAAGDTVRWQIGETTSGTGAGEQAHVLLKPLQRGLETNLVLTTNRRVYMLQLKSGAPDAFNAAVTWDAPPALVETAATDAVAQVAEPVAEPQGAVDGRYRIKPQGHRPRWTPTAVMNDGLRTFITFPPDLQVDESPALFVVAANGQTQMVNYRQQGGVFIVDRLFDRAELRLGDHHPQIVRIERLGGRS
jgi:type IV secretion system protein VirB9